VVGGLWYFYPEPVYPYPDPYIPPVVVVQPTVPVAPTAPVPAAAPQYWYYCEASQNYYPYIATCPSGWKMIPTTPPVAAATPPAPPPPIVPQPPVAPAAPIIPSTLP
jgi:hypothetical protein